MKGLATIAVVLASTTAPHHPQHTRTCSPAEFRQFAAKVWSTDHWRRGDPPQATIDAAIRQRRGCSAPQRRALSRYWRLEKATFYAFRSQMVWRAKYKPYVYPDGTRWAVPWPIAACESGENYFVGPYGAYGLILEPPYMSPPEQDEAAHRLYAEYGEGPWAPFESGCAYR